MPISSEDNIVLKLGIKGVDPAEARAIAQQGAAGLEAAFKESMARQQALYVDQSRAMEAAAKAHAASMTGFAQSTAAAVNAAMASQTDEVNRWSRALSDSAHAAEVFSTVKDIAVEGFEKLKELGEQIIRTSEIFGSLRPNELSGGGAGLVSRIFGGPVEIADARAAVYGAVSDIDLIMSKNRASQLDLDLTAQQFAKVSAVAHQFAEATGTDTPEALNSLITGLATGRARLLQHAGIVIDTKDAYERFAASIQKDVKDLDDHEKALAIQSDAFKKMDDKLAESTTEAQTFGKTLEGVFTGVKNVWDRTLAEIGSIDLSKLPGFSGLRQGMHDLAGFRNVHAAEAIDPEKAAADQDAADRTARFDERYGNAARDRMSRDDFSKLIGAPKDKKGKEYDFQADYEKAQSARDQAQKVANENELLFAQQLVGPAQEGGAEASTKGAHEAFGGVYTDSEINAFVEAQSKAMATIRERMANLNKNKEALGPLSALFGEDFLEKSRSQMTQLEGIVYDSSKSMETTLKSAGDGMANAFGKSLAAAIGEGKGFGAAMQDATHAVLENLAEQALVKSAMFGAEALGDLAVGNLAGAALAGEASAAFAAVGVLAGLGARAVPGSSASQSPGGTPTIAGTPGYAQTKDSVGSGASGNSGGQVVLNVSVMPGGESAAGESIMKALAQYKAASGQSLDQMLRN